LLNPFFYGIFDNIYGRKQSLSDRWKELPKLIAKPLNVIEEAKTSVMRGRLVERSEP
jgi:hypothetical protein